MKKLISLSLISVLSIQSIYSEHAYSHEQAKNIAHHLMHSNQNESVKYFVNSGNLRIIQLMIENLGLDKNYQETDGMHTLLQMAIEQKGNPKPINQVALVKYLLEKGANPNLQSVAGNTPLMYTVKWCIGHKVEKADALALVELLMKYKANPNITNSKEEDVYDWLNILAGRKNYPELQNKIGKKLYTNSYLAYNIRKIIDEATNR